MTDGETTETSLTIRTSSQPKERSAVRDAHAGVYAVAEPSQTVHPRSTTSTRVTSSATASVGVDSDSAGGW